MKTYDTEEWLKFIKDNDFTHIHEVVMQEMSGSLAPHPESISNADDVLLRKQFLYLDDFSVDKGKRTFFVEYDMVYELDPNDNTKISGDLFSVTLFDNQGQYDLYRGMSAVQDNVKPTPQSN